MNITRREFLKASSLGIAALLVCIPKISRRVFEPSDYCAVWHRGNRHVKIPNNINFQDVLDRTKPGDWIFIIPPGLRVDGPITIPAGVNLSGSFSAIGRDGVPAITVRGTYANLHSGAQPTHRIARRESNAGASGAF